MIPIPVGKMDAMGFSLAAVQNFSGEIVFTSDIEVVAKILADQGGPLSLTDVPNNKSMERERFGADQTGAEIGKSKKAQTHH